MRKKLIFLIILLIIPSLTYADDTNKYYIDVTVNEDGSATFREYIDLSGSYNYLYRNLYLKGNNKLFEGDNSSDYYKTDIYNAGDITDICVGEEKRSITDFSYANDDYACYELITNGKNGMSGYYEYLDNGNKKEIKIYNHSSNNKAFVITYHVTDIIVTHEDIAELLFNFEWSEDISDIKLRVNLPSDSKELRVFTHGPANGMNEILDKHTVYGEWDFLNANTKIDMRVVFDNELVPNNNKRTYVMALDNILKFEEEQAKIQNNLRKKARIKILIANIIEGAWILGFILIGYNFYKKYDKEYKAKFNNEYMRDIPATYGPEILGYLLSASYIKPEYLSASVMELIRKKNLKVEMDANDKNKFTITMSNKDNLTDTEDILIDFLINEVGNGVSVTSEDIKKASKKEYASFIKKYTEWKNKVIEKGKEEKFYENIGSKQAIGILYSLLGIGIFSLVLGLSLNNVLVYFVLILSIFGIVYFAVAKKKTIKGCEDYAKWMAFKKFLLDFGRFNDKEILEIHLWEKYLVYATVFGIADKVEKAMNMKIKELNYNEDTINTSPIFYTYHMGFGNSITNSITESLTRAITTAQTAASSDSNGSGFGGGASFGGGGGGFGGGGGRG